MNTTTNLQEEDILKLLDEYFQTDYSVKDFCYFNDGLDETLFLSWIDKYAPQHSAAVSPFVDIILKEDRKQGRPRKQQGTDTPQLFARVGDIELYQQVSAAFLKSLRS